MIDVKIVSEMLDKTATSEVERPVLPDRLERRSLDFDRGLESKRVQTEVTVDDAGESDNPDNKTRQLTPEEREYYKERLGCTDTQLDKITIDEDGKIHLKTINEDISVTDIIESTGFAR